jgi:hypothetical protein
MKPTEFLTEGNQHCPKCDCNTVTTDTGKCKLCGTKKLDEKQVVEQQMLDVAAIFLEAKKQGDKATMLAAQQKLAELNEVKHFRTAYGWAGGRNEKTGGVHKHPGNKEYTVYCSQCGGEFRRNNKNGFSHCKDHDGMHNYDLDEEGGRWEYDRNGNMHEKTPQQAAAHAKANLARMNKSSNPFDDDDEYGNHQTHAKDEHGNVFHEDENLDEVKSGEIANHPWVCRRAKIKGTGEVGEVIRVCREHTFSQMVPFVTMVWIKLDSGETKEVRQNHVQIAKKTTGLDEDTSSSCIAVAPSGKTGPSGPAGSLFGGPPERKVKETKKVVKRSNIGEGIALAESFPGPFKSFQEANEYFRDKAHERGNNPVQQFGEGDAEKYRRFVMSHVQKKTNEGKLNEYSTAAQRAEAEKSYQEFIAKGGQPKPAPNKKYKEPSPGTGCGGTRVAGRGEAARGGGSGKPGLKSRTGKAAHNPIARPKIVGEDGQLNEYKPKIIPKTLAGGKLNPNHPGNTSAIASEKEAKYKRQERAKQERTARTASAQERKRREAQKEKARKAGQKAKASLGSANPTNPLEQKAKDAMFDVWQAIAPDMMQAISGSNDGYSEDEDLLNDPFWVAEVCCDANHMQTFAHLSPEEEREILDTLDQKTLARLASDFGY